MKEPPIDSSPNHEELPEAAKAIGLMDRTERAAFVNEYSSFCSEVASSSRTQTNKRHNDHDGRLKAALNPPMRLEEYVSKVGAHVESTLAAVALIQRSTEHEQLFLRCRQLGGLI